MKITIIEQPTLRLITAKSKKFPEANRAAFNLLESQLETLRGRKFYGLVFESNSGMDYHAGLVPENQEEEDKFRELGFSIQEISGGLCARFKMIDWESKIDQIGPTMGAMIAEYGVDSTRPQMEFYRSLTELHLILPIPLETQTKGRADDGS